MADRTIVTRMRVEYNQAVSGMQAVGSAATQAANRIEGAGKKSDGAFSKMAQQAQQNRQAWETAGTALTVVGGAITGIGLAAGKTGIEYNTLQQTSRAAMKTLMGGAEQANAQMDKLDKFAKTSPFAKQVFIQAQQQPGEESAYPQDAHATAQPRSG